MAGLYIHIPYCKKACHYCNFHFSTQLSSKADMVEAICTELFWRKSYLGNEFTISSIYFGGGTPSLLTPLELEKIFDTIYTHYNIASDAEITLEANPDDLDVSGINTLKRTPVNRLSIGIQSFQEDALRWMNRSHDASQAKSSIRMAQDAGFHNMSVDLIYGLPSPYHLALEDDLQQIIDLKVPHISCYGLTVEPSTALAYQVKKKSSLMLAEEDTNAQYLYISETVEMAGYRHYEISNIALPGFEAAHNSSYWTGEPYLGIGPSAHSYKPYERSWNVSNNIAYVKAIKSGQLSKELEYLSLHDRYNEYIMTGLRLDIGIDLQLISDTFGEDYKKYLLAQLLQVDPENYILPNNRLILTRAGILWCDKISSLLFMTV